MNVTVIIPTIHADDAMLETACQRVFDTTGIEPVVVDGGTFSENCNVGAEAADTDIVLFLNDDTEVQDGWLEPLIDPIIRDPTVAITGSKLVYPDGRIQHAGIHLYANDGVLHGQNICWNAGSGPVTAVTGACMAVRTDIYKEVGGFDTAYRNGNEDIDLCLKATMVGYRVIYVAESVVIHHESQSGPARWAYTPQNVQLLNERWGNGQSETPTPDVDQ